MRRSPMRGDPKINTGFRATVELIDQMNAIADRLGVSRNEYLTTLVKWDLDHLDEGIPAWWQQYKTRPRQGTLISDN